MELKNLTKGEKLMYVSTGDVNVDIGFYYVQHCCQTVGIGAIDERNDNLLAAMIVTDQGRAFLVENIGLINAGVETALRHLFNVYFC
ncbi:hypothetical protein [Sphingobacterium sp.]|uniref:hypothetical protein n=1 Tax=Sphingobacterium sp. TaxID=341027 RepID=UPI002898BF7C|nr:hypothetical protein [Sphingobacterium sp.]